MLMKKKLTEEQEKEIQILRANNEMLEKTKAEAKARGNKKSVERIQIAQDEVIDHIKSIDPSAVEDIKPKRSGRKKPTSVVDEMVEAHNDVKSVFDALDEYNAELEEVKVKNDTSSNQTVYEDLSRLPNKYDYNDIDPEAQYDIVALPSNGQCYKQKIERVPVAYLTAHDENAITSPVLYKDGLVVDYLIKNKVMNSEINVDELCSGDADAIILFLRATSYGPEFPVNVSDPETGVVIEETIDLGQIKAKEFKLVGDENGYFDYQLPLSKDNVKFRFLTRKDEKNLSLLNKLDTDKTRGEVVFKSVKNIEMAVKSDTKLDKDEKKLFMDSLEKMNEWANKLGDTNEISFPNTITNRMEMNIVSVNGNTDRKYIAKYVRNMNTRDSLAFRKYVLENEPGLDFEVEIRRPESLGGGSFKTFLEWNDYVLYNIA